MLSDKAPWLMRLYRQGLGFESFAIGFGLLLACAATWPVYYGFFRGGAAFDYEALSAGVIGLTIGLSIAMWGIRRRRKPQRAVWLDLRERVITVTDGAQRSTASFEQLGALVVKRRKYRVRSKRGTRIVVSYGVLAPGAFQETRLFDDRSEATSQAWAERVRRLVAAPDVGALAFDEVALRAAEKAFDAPRATVLWNAAAFAVDGRLDADAFESARAEYETARGSLLGRFLASTGFGAVLLAVLVTTVVWLVPLSVDRTHGGDLEVVVAGAVCAGFAALWLRLAGQWPLAVLMALSAGGALVAKPFVSPLVSDFMGEVHTYGLTSETHLYFLLPGLALLVFGAGIAVAPKKG